MQIFKSKTILQIHEAWIACTEHQTCISQYYKKRSCKFTSTDTLFGSDLSGKRTVRKKFLSLVSKNSGQAVVIVSNAFMNW